MNLYWSLDTAKLRLLAQQKEERLKALRQQGFIYSSGRIESEVLNRQLVNIYKELERRKVKS